MNWMIIRNDFLRNKVINITLLLFITLSSVLASVSVLMGVQTFSSISELYEEAKPPHFLQMHKGEIDEEMIEDFMNDYEGVTYWQSVEMYNVYGESLTITNDEKTYDLSDSRLDIGMVTQNDSRDLLLNAKHEVVVVEQGEIGMPVLLSERYGMEIGDTVVFQHEGVEIVFVITEFVLDSQMNSPMVSSTRILVNEEDFDMLKTTNGEIEYLIEVYFEQTGDSSSFQSAYENAGLPQNGQAVTYSMIFLLSAITDVTTVFVLLLVSILLVIVSFICVRFTMMAALEEEVTEIGAMKAIGLPFRDIRNLYLMKYRILAFVSVVLGFVIALISNDLFTSHISTTFGDVGLSPLAIILSLLVGVIIFIIITYYCKKVLKKIKRITVVDSLVKGKGFAKEEGKVRDGLYKSKKLTTNWLMALREVVYKFKNWIIVFAVVCIALVMIMIPVNLMNTFDSPEFVTYMGSSLEDILIEVENGEDLEINQDKVVQLLESDERVQEYFAYRRVRVQTMDADQQLMNLHIDTGAYAGNDLKYLQGTAPKLENEIAISYLNMEQIGKNVLDTIVLYYNGIEQEYVISGIYQDVTSGGFTAKSKHAFSELDSQKYSFSVNLVEDADIVNTANEWSQSIGVGVSIDPMDEFIDQTLGGVVKQLRAIVILIVLIGAALVLLITVLFLKLRLVKDYAEIAVMKAIGFSEKDLRIQYYIKIGVITMIGVLLGVLFTNILGERIVNLVLSISGLGLKSVDLIVNPWIQYLFVPLLLVGLVLIATGVVLNMVKKYNIVSIINE